MVLKPMSKVYLLLMLLRRHPLMIALTFKPVPMWICFSTLGALSSALNTYQSDSVGSAAFHNKLNTALSDLSNSLGSVVTRQAYLGARMNETDSVKDTTEDMKLQYTTTLTALEGLDYAAAISDFAENQMVLDATRKSFAQVQDLSLFKYI
ncbi:hypothetical protein GKO28_13020 [Deefgea sp. CFH1-16]|nr:hypothetical protein [Deefgea sp. CFH1-16]